MRLGDVKVGTKLFARFVPVAVLVAVVGGIGLFSINRIAGEADEITEV